MYGTLVAFGVTWVLWGVLGCFRALAVFGCDWGVFWGWVFVFWGVGCLGGVFARVLVFRVFAEFWGVFWVCSGCFIVFWGVEGVWGSFWPFVVFWGSFGVCIGVLGGVACFGVFRGVLRSFGRGGEGRGGA